MDIAGVALRRAQIGFGAGIRRESGEPSVFSGRSVPGARGGLRVPARARGGGDFADEGHLKFYASPARCGEKRKEGKKRAKLIKGLTKDLSNLYSMGFGVEAGEGLDAEVKGKTISEAAELLLAQLSQMKAQEKEMMKKKRKEEKAATKATRMKACAKDDTSSSSSSSESSDSECEGTVNMSCLRTASASAAPQSQGAATAKPAAVPQWNPNSPLQTQSVEENQLTLERAALECCGRRSITAQGCRGGSVAVVEKKPMDKIEVCMGGKCKRSGALELMQEFERKVGIEGAVVGCKCMGKCKEGPNVRVPSHIAEEDSVTLSRNTLCIGVGLEDVDTMVADFFGGKDVGLMAA